MTNENWLDRAIAWLNPRWGVRRVRARALHSIMLAYEGSRTDRRASGWITADSSANAEIGPSISYLRRRSRALVRDTSYGARGLNELADHAVGTGITAQSRAADKGLAKQIDEAWKIWLTECDADRQLDFYGLEHLAVRSTVEGGECIIRIRPRFASDGLYVPLQIQLLEGDHLDHSKTEATKNGGYIIQGVEFNGIGRRVAYWLYNHHPGETSIPWTGSDAFASHRVDARYVIHLYQKDRASQVRGVPWLAPVIIAMRDLDEYIEAEIVRKKIEACFASFITQPEGSDGPAIGATKTQDGQQVDTIEPGMITYLKSGEDVKFATPTGSGQGYGEFVRKMETRIASGIGLSYEQLTGDLSNINYSSFKAGQISFRNRMDVFRWLTFVPMFCAPIRRAFIEAAYAAGRIPELDYTSEWHPPSYGSVDPQKDALAKLIRIRTGMQTWEQGVAEEGYDPEEQIEGIKRANKMLDDAGIVVDCDPRQRTASGNALGSKEPEEKEGPPQEEE
jgi:lambda family phage portal protein